ncbi:hypothetical protein ACWDA7_50840 [Streptomyces sp. NPDC001156]
MDGVFGTRNVGFFPIRRRPRALPAQGFYRDHRMNLTALHFRRAV